MTGFFFFFCHRV